MTTSTVPGPRSVSSNPLRTIPTYWRMLLRGQLTRGRLVGLGALGAVGILLAVVSRSDDATIQVEVLAEYGIALLMPLAALLLATPMIGNLIEDRLLVYLWLKPIPRWHLAVAALFAVVSVLLPVVLVPLVAMVLIMGTSGALVPIIMISVLGCAAYGGLYLFFGARFGFGLWLGIVHLVLFEQIISRWSSGAAQASIRSYLNSILERGTDVEVSLGDRSSVASLVVPIAIAAIATALTAWALSKRDID